MLAKVTGKVCEDVCLSKDNDVPGLHQVVVSQVVTPH